MLALCAVVFWVRLGADGLGATEGHRAVPGWEMLDTGRWLVPTMFDQAYLRKPPGMSWAVALSSMVFGHTEFAARAVSATAMTLMALLALVFARRWFGPRYAAAAGIACALTPWFWQFGRAAEIEALNCMFIQLGVFLVADRLVFSRKSIPFDAVATLVAGLALGAALLTKGPVGVAIGAAVVAGACVATRSPRPFARPLVWIAVSIGSLCFIVWALAAQRAIERDAISVVTQSFSVFLWDASRVPGIMTLAPVAFAAALPLSLVVLFPFGPDATREFDDPSHRELHIARTLAWGCVLSLVLLVLAGVSNPRYAMPAFVFTPPLVTYVLAGWFERFGPRRRAIAGVMLLGRPGVLASVLLVGAGAWIFAIEPRRDARSGRDVGTALAEYLSDGSIVLADHLVEARPEVLWYAQQAARRNGRRVVFRWIPGLAAESGILRDEEFLLLRTDDSGEAQRMRDAGILDGLHEMTALKVHTYTFSLFGR